MSTIKLPCTVHARKDSRGRIFAHVASVDGVNYGPEGEASSATEAKRRLEERLARSLAEARPPLVLFDLVEPGKVWICYQEPTGAWAYMIVRHALEHMPRGASWETGQIGSYESRDAAHDAMRRHWYQLNVEPLVDALRMLGSGERQWVCRACHSVQRAAPDRVGQGDAYRCRAPGCGVVEYRADERERAA